MSSMAGRHNHDHRESPLNLKVLNAPAPAPRPKAVRTDGVWLEGTYVRKVDTPNRTVSLATTMRSREIFDVTNIKVAYPEVERPKTERTFADIAKSFEGMPLVGMQLEVKFGNSRRHRTGK